MPPPPPTENLHLTALRTAKLLNCLAVMVFALSFQRITELASPPPDTAAWATTLRILSAILQTVALPLFCWALARDLRRVARLRPTPQGLPTSPDF